MVQCKIVDRRFFLMAMLSVGVQVFAALFTTQPVQAQPVAHSLAQGPALGAATPAGSPSPDESDEWPVRRLTTSGGVEYGLWGSASAKQPAPTLFVLASTIAGTLGDKYFRQSANALAAHGYLAVSIDLPCHGTQTRRGEPAGLSGWSQRAGADDDFVAESNGRLSQVLDVLIETGVADPKRIAACGTSRGGFLAYQFAAHDPRVKCVAGFAPVTDLTALREFRGREQHPLVRQLNILERADQLAGRAVWIIIGDQDQRVGTQHAIDLARQITAASLERKVPSRVELHVMPEPRGHTTPRGASQMAAAWIHRELSEADAP